MMVLIVTRLATTISFHFLQNPFPCRGEDPPIKCTVLQFFALFCIESCFVIMLEFNVLEDVVVQLFFSDSFSLLQFHCSKCNAALSESLAQCTLPSLPSLTHWLIALYLALSTTHSGPCSTLPAAVASLSALTDRSSDLLLLPLLMLCILLLLPLLVMLLHTITTDHGPICLLLQICHSLFGHLSLLVYFSCHCFFF